ncbi:MAG: hypothetical protein A2046_04205 [Bacteroidetes bacterium GWA2_30_7]|nr:MAG: hypothetical protein A2046_04205 [Bacteroidetes bacterium GWA2_30_7]
MKTKIIITIICLISISLAKAQQLPIYSQYMFNSFLINPATAGSVSYFPIRLTARNQWAGMSQAPKTQAISAHTLINGRTEAVGGYLFNDKYGPVSRTGALAAFAHHINIDKYSSKLALGLSVSAFQIKLDQREMNLNDKNDPLISGAIEQKFMPDAAFGAYYYTSQYYVGVSAAQLFQFKVNLGENATKQSALVRHYYFMAGYNYAISNDFDIEPSLLLKTTKGTAIQADINARVYYKKDYWLGISYRTSDAIIAFLGVKYKDFVLGYAFDYTTSIVGNYSNGSHEIMLGYNLKGKSKGSSLL